MMHGFGDHSEPLLESARLVEEVVLSQMRAIIRRACEVADTRATGQVVGAEEFLFMLRKDKVKLQRLVNYLSKNSPPPHTRALLFSVVTATCERLGVYPDGKSVFPHSRCACV